MVEMKRRDFITLLGGAAAWPTAAGAQQKAMPVIGFLNARSPGEAAGVCRGVPAGAERNRLCRGKKRRDRIPLGGGPLRSVAGIGRRPRQPQGRRDRGGGLPPSRAAKNATATIPIVFLGIRPGPRRPRRQPRPAGRQRHGLHRPQRRTDTQATRADVRASSSGPDDRAPGKPQQSDCRATIEDVQGAARVKGLQLQILKAGSADEIEAAFASLVQLQAGAVVVGADPFFNSRREQMAALASRHAVPAIYEYREFPAAGGLISYGPSLTRTVGARSVFTLEGSSRAPSRPICRSSSRQHSSWSSTSTPPRRSASPYRHRFSPAPTR